MKAFLKGSDGILALRPKITTIGRHEDSDILLKSLGIEDHHAAIEFSNSENSFILRDFNSTHGTFVNDCHIQNAAVKVSPGDILRFGSNGPMFELVLENASQVSCPPVSRRTAWPGLLQILTETKTSPAAAATAQIPFLQSQRSPPIHRSWSYGASGTSLQPPLRNKPINAWGRAVPSPSFSPDPFGRSPAVVSGNGAATNTHQGDTLFKERDEVILKMENEISRLSRFESECDRKDVVIAKLQSEIAAMTEKITIALAKKDAEFRQKPVAFEQDVGAKTEEIKALREQINNLQQNTSEVLYHSLSERDLQIAHWKQENETLKKNYSLTMGLVTSLQKDITSKDQKIQHLKMEAEKLRREIREKDNQLAHVSAQCSRIKEETKRELRERDVTEYQNHISELELQVKRSEDEIKKYRAEQETLSNRLVEKTKAEGDLKKEFEKRSQQLREMGRRERLMKSDRELTATQVSSLDLADLGARCKGCRHEETIHRQKDALAELRQRIKMLEKTRPLDFEEKTAEQLIVLKKGPMEQRVRKTEKVQVTALMTAVDADQLQSGVPSVDPNVVIERTAKLEMADALDLSENMYLSLIQNLASLMNVKELMGMQTVKHLPQDEREKVGTLREKDLELLFDKITKLKNRLERKESLLKEYERDIWQFRTNKQTLQACQSEMAKLSDKIYREAEEKALLKEALERMKLQLTQEKRLSRAFTQKKNNLEKRSETSSWCGCTQKFKNRKVATPKKPVPANQKAIERPVEDCKKQAHCSASA